VESSGNLPNQAIWFLVNAYLVRAEQRGGATWFELSHDRLIGPVRENNRRWFDQNLNALQQRSGLWQQQGKPDSLLLRDTELSQAETWVQDHPAELNPVDQEFFDACLKIRQRDVEERERQAQAIKLQEQQKVAKVLKRLLTFAIVAAVAAGIFGVIALLAGMQARSESQANSTLAVQRDQNARTAEAASTLAVGNASTAEANANAARIAEATASSDRAIAVAAGATAQVAEATAVYNAQVASEKEGEARISAHQALQQAGLANSRRLASLAQGFIDTQADLTSLLGIEALNITRTYEAKNVLLARLQRSLELNIEDYWRSPTGQSDVNFVAFSPVGERMAYGSSDGSVVILNYESQQIERVLRRDAVIPFAGKVDTVAFSPDGKMVASGGPDTFIIIWNVETGEAVYQLKNVARVFSLSYNPKNGNQLVAGVGTGLVYWDLTTLQRTSMGTFVNFVYSVAWSPDGTRIAAGSADRFVKIWRSNLLTNPIQDYRLHTNKIWSVAWSPDSKTLASTAEDSTIIFWDVEEDKPIGDPIRAYHGFAGYSVSFSSDGKILVSGGADGNLAFWDANTLTLLAEHKHHIDAVVSVAFSPVGGELIVASSSLDNTMLLHRLTAAQPLSEPIPAPTRGQILSLANLPGERLLAAEKVGSQVRIWDLGQDSNQPAASLQAAEGASAAFSPDGSLLALGGSDGVIQVFDWVNGNGLATFAADSQEVLALTFSPDGQELISAQCEEVLSGEDSEKLDHSPCIRHKLLTWSLDTGQVSNQISLDQTSGPMDFVRSLAVDRGGKLLAIGSEDGSIMLWDLMVGQPDGVPLDQHSASVTSLSFSPDGTTLASGGTDQALILWDVDSHQSIASPIYGSANTLTSLAYSPEDRLVSGDASGKLLSWYADDLSWIERNCTMTRRNLTPVEWRQYVSQSGETYRATCDQFPLEIAQSAAGSDASTPTPRP
jgi:WD40 repeat protein